MFSCCRANPKKQKQIINDVSENNTIKEIENVATAAAATTTTSDNKNLVIPTITIDNGKTTDETNGTSTIITTTTTTNTSSEKLVNGFNKNDNGEAIKTAITTSTTPTPTTTTTTTAENLAKQFSEEESLAETGTITTIATIIEKAVKEDEQDADGTSDINVVDVDADVEKSHHSNNAESSAVTNSNLPSDKEHDVCSQAKEREPIHGNDDSGSTDITTATIEEESQKDHLPATPSKDCANSQVVRSPQPKSCLSRHNSTHASIKKRVNISTHAEIIEPEPLPPILMKSASLGDDEDDVFSDSLPPPKRDSMCAPYIERDDDFTDVISESLAYSHGLPEWFNDERINDMGCIEPPVTPVGRDELELKRQRLYEDLLRAAQAAVEHSTRFQPLPFSHMSNASTLLQPPPPPPQPPPTFLECGGDCDPNLKPSIAENLEILVNRLEKLVERLERSISARELDIANRTFDTVLEHKRISCTLEEKLPSPPALTGTAAQLDEPTGHLNHRIERIEESLNRINERHSLSSYSECIPQQQNLDDSLENIPTVLDDFSSLPPPPPPLELSMSVLGYQDIVNGPLSQYLALSAKIGGDVAKHAEFVKKAFDSQLAYITLATQCSKPNQNKQTELLKPTSDQITAIQDFREKNRASQFFNHLSAISESIPALGWVCVSPTPGPHVKEMNDAGQFYTNRVLKEWKEKDAKHVEWARAWVQTLTELQKYIKQYHTTGLVWSGKGAAPASGAAPPPPPMGGCPPPPPPPTFDMSNMNMNDAGDERSALFAEINQGENITKSLKKVTADMQTHKNPTLRSGPAPFKTPTQFGSAGSASAGPVVKEPVFTRDGKKWLIEFQKQNPNLLVENAEMNNVVYMFKCEGSTLTVKGKVNNVVLDSCKKCSLLFDSVVASIEFVNCQSVQMQVLGHVPTVIIDKTDGCQMYLSKDSMAVEIVSSKSSEMNVMLPAANGDYTELPLPEQFKTTISGKTLKTVCVDSLG